MGLFKKKQEKVNTPRLPELPPLPELPELPEFKEGEDSDDYIAQLPSFPKSSLGNKFSQNTIKEAITGRKGVEEAEANEFAREEDEGQMMQRPLVREFPRKQFPNQGQQFKQRPQQQFKQKIEQPQQQTKESEPIFIRIDNFEEGSKTFEEVKKQIVDIEKKFREIKSVKEEEERELSSWNEEIQKIKGKIEKIDRNIFSKV